MNRHASMNRVYRLIWSAVRDLWIPVAETSRGRGKRTRRTLVAAALSLAAALAHAAGPSGGQVTAGSGTITQSGAVTTITQDSSKLSLSWTSFNIAPQATVDFVQPSTSAIAVNRIFDTNGTQILGHLNANGQVFLINPNGIVFGAGAVVNVGGLVAAALDLNEASLDAASKSFSGTSADSVVNEGTLSATPGGYVVLLGNHVSNQGVISAQLGSVALAAGSAATLTFNNNSLVHLQVDQSLWHSLAENGGVIQANGGQVIMTAGAKNALVASAVNNTGVIEARTVQSREGSITLLGGMADGTVTVGGTLDASAPSGGNGGSIETSAAHVEVADGAKVTTAAASGLYGSWLIDPTDFNVAASGGNITGAQLSTDLGTTNVSLKSSSGTTGVSGNVNVNDAVSWSADTTLTLTASNDVNINANITATGNTAGLVILPNTANGGQTASGTGIYTLLNGASITLSGATPSLSIASIPYIVINSLGAVGSTTGTDLQGINGGLSGHYALGSNLDASGTSAWNGGAGFTPIGSQAMAFTGTFDGLGHTISNLTIDQSGASDVGLFGFATGLIQNVGLVGASVTGNNNVGALVGYNGGTVNNSYATGSVSGNSYVGGLVGFNDNSITNSSSSSSVSGVTNVGGLVGINDYSTITNSYATGTVSGTGGNVGGLVGYGNYGSITNSHATGTVAGTTAVGGLVGFNYGGTNGGTINNSYATGHVSGTSGDVGGLVGYVDFGAIANSYATGSVTGVGNVGGLVGYNQGSISNSHAGTGGVIGTGSYVGGLVGLNTNGGAISNSYATGSVTGSNYAGGLAGGSIYSISTIDSSYATGPVSGYAIVGGLVGKDAGTVSNSYAAGRVTGNTEVGGLVGWSYGAITASHATGAVSASGNQAGGLVGNTAAAVSDSYATGAVSGSSYVGGLLGVAETEGTAPISNSYATGVVSGSGSYVGGLVGFSAFPISNSHASGAVSGASDVGGLVGYNSYTISDSYATGTVTGSSSLGGLVGYNNYGAISSSHATGSVSGGSDYDGGLVGLSNGGTVSSSYATGNVSGGTHIGGLLGESDTTISSSYATGNVSGSGEVGGLVGGSYGAITASHATGAVSAGSGSIVGGLVGSDRGSIDGSYATGAVSGNSYVGGLVGVAATMGTEPISNSYATGSISGSGNYIGGLVGMNNFAISDSYATGAVSGGSNVGGLVGLNYYTVANSYATGTVGGGSSVGGLVGGNYGTISNTYATGRVTAAGNDAGGLVGDNTSAVTASFWNMDINAIGIGAGATTGATGLTTAGMMTMSNFSAAGWSIADTGDSGPIWRIYQGETAPLLLYFMTPLTVTADNVTKTYTGVPVTGLTDASYSVAGAASSGHIFNAGNPYNGAVNVGSYAPDLYSDQQGYDISYAGGGILTITPATLTVTATAATKTYGEANPALSGSVTGFVDGQTLASATTGSEIYSTPATLTSNVGTYAITGSGLSADNGNYIFAFAAGDASAFSITPATLTYTAAGASFAAGQIPSGLSGTLSGFVLGQTQATATAGTLDWTTDAGSDSPPGRYAIDGSGLTAMNYVFVEAGGNATALTLRPGSAVGPPLGMLLQAQIAVGTLEADLPASETTIQLAPLYLAQDSTSNGIVEDDRVVLDARLPSLRVVHGGLKLPDNMVDVNAQ